VIQLGAYDVITNRIIELLEQGTVPWKKPWANGSAPKNLKSGKEYNGINSLLLNVASYASPYWLTYRQANERGGHVKKGEKGYPVVFWKWLDKKEDDSDDENTKRIPLLRYYTVFNVEQCNNIEYPQPAGHTLEFNPIDKCEDVVSQMPHPPKITHEEQRAFYRPLEDRVNMPRKESFGSEPEYYSTLFHELSHATGHSARLDRPGITKPAPHGSYPYFREELVAETGAAFLCGHCSIDTRTIENSASYINDWLKMLKEDKRLVITASAQGQKAADYVLGKR